MKVTASSRRQVSVLSGACSLLVSLGANALPIQETLLEAILRDRSRWIGAADTTAGAQSKGALARIVSGRIAPDGQHYVVLDSEAPFVKVFRRDGTVRSEFLTKGSGPREMRSPHTVAVNAQNRILVLDAPNRVQLYDLDGKLLQEHTSHDHMMFDAVEGCNADEWLAYGTSRETDKANPWVTRVTLKAGALQHETVYADEQRPMRMAFGNARGMVQHGRSLVLDHRAGTDRTLVEWQCDQREPRARSLARVFEEFTPKEQRNGNTMSLQLREGMEMPSGVAVAGSAILFFDQVLVMGDKPPKSHVTVLQGNKPLRYTFAAQLRALDSRPGLGTLLAVRDPYPHVVLVSEKELTAALSIR